MGKNCSRSIKCYQWPTFSTWKYCKWLGKYGFNHTQPIETWKKQWKKSSFSNESCWESSKGTRWKQENLQCVVWNKADITRTKTDGPAKMVLQWSRWENLWCGFVYQNWRFSGKYLSIWNDQWNRIKQRWTYSKSCYQVQKKQRKHWPLYHSCSTWTSPHSSSGWDAHHGRIGKSCYNE